MTVSNVKTVNPTKHLIKPLRVFKTAEKLMRIYSEWQTGDVEDASKWSSVYFYQFALTLIQSQLPEGATLVGTLISLDKTKPISSNESIESHFYVTSRSSLDSQMYRVRGQTKKAAEIKIMMSDPLGWHRYCFSPLVGAITVVSKSSVTGSISITSQRIS